MSKTFIKELDIISFGKFSNKKIKLDPGFNLIYGVNESGKSTLADFIEGVLYGFDEGNKRKSFSYKKEKYKPAMAYSYGGRILFSHQGSDILVERNFDSGDYRIYDLGKNEEIKSKATDLNYPGKFLLGLSYKAYQNLIKNYQSQSLDKDSRKILTEIFMDSSFDLDFSSNKAIEILENNLKDLGSDRAYTKPYYLVKKKIESIEKDLRALKSLRLDYSRDLEILYDQRKKLKSLKEELEKLRKERDAYRSKIAGENYRQEKEVKDQIKKLDQDLKSYDSYEEIDRDYFKKVDKLIELKGEHSSKDKPKKSLLPFLLIGLLIIILAIIIQKPLFLGLLLLIYPLYIFMDKKEEPEYEDKLNEFFSKYSLKSLDDYRKFKNTYYDYLALKTQRDKLTDILDVLSRQEKKDYDLGFDKNIDITKLEDQIRNLEKTYSKLSLENIDLEKKLAYVEEDLKKELPLVDDLNFYKKKLLAIEEEKEANRLAIDLIEKSKRDDEKGLEDLNRKINEIIGQISKGAYKKISYDENLKPLIITKDGLSLSLDQVSTGFFDQLSFALKFALREKVYKNKYIIFDDSFINFDDIRLEDALYYLLDLAEDNQIIYLTCHSREEEFLAREEILVNKIILE